MEEVDKGCSEFHGFPGLFTDTSELIHFYFFPLLVVCSMQQIKLTYVSF